MNAPAALALPAIGARLEGGYFVGAILLPDGPWGLIKAPKAALDLGRVAWDPQYRGVADAKSFIDGPGNTRAMADAGIDLAQKILGFEFEGKKDFYLLAADEHEVVYRNCKPTADENSMYMRSGINLHAWPAPTHPYSVDGGPKQTDVDLFRADGAEAFSTDEPYWTSTQHAGLSDYAWLQWFNDGGQSYWDKGGKCRVCLVRRFKI